MDTELTVPGVAPAIPVPEPGLTPAAMVARAAALREEAPLAEERGGYSVAMHAAAPQVGAEFAAPRTHIAAQDATARVHLGLPLTS